MEIVSSSGVNGYLCLVLHAHLPYIRYPENEQHLEERWLFEAITETYIPLLQLFENLLNDNVDFRITLSLTPTLTEMFNDDLLMERYQRYIDGLIELADKEISRTAGDRKLRPVARMYHEKFVRVRHLFQNVYRKKLTGAFRALLSTGQVEIVAGAATHPFLPSLMPVREAARAQILLGIEYFRSVFGKKPGGIWLPECGFAPGIDLLLKEAGVSFFFLESHGLIGSTPPCRHSIYKPIKTPSGVFAFSRDVDSSKQVWSSAGGYPGDFEYRDFFRDIGFDLALDYLKPYLPDGIRTFTGMKYFRITDKSDRKKPYIRERALKKAEAHADHFVAAKKNQLHSLRRQPGIGPVITAAYDAELFGHWWFEGPDWLNFVLRKAASGHTSFRLITPSEYISMEKETQIAMPSMSSWGDKGYSSTWINPGNEWIHKHLNRAGKLMVELSCAHMDPPGLVRRALNQAARELLLAQASDWAFMMKTDNAAEFAKKKFTRHLDNFLRLHRELLSGSIEESNLASLERKNNIFRDIDYRIFSKAYGLAQQLVERV